MLFFLVFSPQVTSGTGSSEIPGEPATAITDTCTLKWETTYAVSFKF